MTATPQREAEIETRFWSHVHKTPTCWVWTGTTNKSRRGYGIMVHGGVRVQAHRLAHTLLVGPIPEGMFVCHHCDNPPCVRPDHLFLGTQADNIHDMMQKGRHRTSFTRATHCQRGHALQGSNVRLDRRGKQICITCAKAYQHRWYLKHQEHHKQVQRDRHWPARRERLRLLAARGGKEGI